nr:4-hydroxybenzoate polyprenyltransferase, mitochondrial [Quercus suber]
MTVVKQVDSPCSAAPLPRSSRLLRSLPASWIPYAELSRIHKPTGIFNIAFPYLFGALYTAWTSNPPPLDLAKDVGILFAASFVLRSAGCCWNDIVDRDVDRLVARSRLRPMARRALKANEAMMFAGTLFMIWFAILSTTSARHWIHSVPILAMVLMYPYAKRYTHWAQLFLGVTLASGVLVGANISRVEVLVAEAWLDPPASRGVMGLFSSYAVWCVIHDTIYAQQDIEDDITAGVLSTAILFRNHFHYFLGALSLLQVGLHFYTGFVSEAGLIYHIPAVFLCGLFLASMLVSVDIMDPSSCAWWFKNGSLAYGLLLGLALLGEYCSRRWIP